MLIFHINAFEVDTLDKLNTYPVNRDLSVQFTGKVAGETIGNPGL